MCDYLHILLKLAGANETTKFMAYYLSEMVLLHTIFGRWAMIHSTYTYIILLVKHECSLGVQQILGRNDDLHVLPW